MNIDTTQPAIHSFVEEQTDQTILHSSIESTLKRHGLGLEKYATDFETFSSEYQSIRDEVRNRFYTHYTQFSTFLNNYAEATEYQKEEILEFDLIFSLHYSLFFGNSSDLMGYMKNYLFPYLAKNLDGFDLSIFNVDCLSKSDFETIRHAVKAILKASHHAKSPIYIGSDDQDEIEEIRQYISGILTFGKIQESEEIQALYKSYSGDLNALQETFTAFVDLLISQIDEFVESIIDIDDELYKYICESDVPRIDHREYVQMPPIFENPELLLFKNEMDLIKEEVRSRVSQFLDQTYKNLLAEKGVSKEALTQYSIMNFIFSLALGDADELMISSNKLLSALKHEEVTSWFNIDVLSQGDWKALSYLQKIVIKSIYFGNIKAAFSFFEEIGLCQNDVHDIDDSYLFTVDHDLDELKVIFETYEGDINVLKEKANAFSLSLENVISTTTDALLSTYGLEEFMFTEDEEYDYFNSDE